MTLKFSRSLDRSLLVSRSLLGLLVASAAAAAFALPPGTPDEILERIRPVGAVSTPAAAASDEPVVAVARTGEDIYNTYCTACHTAGVAGAPVFGDADAWAPRIAKGTEVLYESTYNGLNGVMPVRGTCADCSDEDLRNTVDYMVSAAKG